MKWGFKIPSAKEFEAKNKAGVEKKNMKLPDTTDVDWVIGGAISPYGLTESFPYKTTPSQERAKIRMV